MIIRKCSTKLCSLWCKTLLLSLNKLYTILLLLFLKCLRLIIQALHSSTTTLFLSKMHEYYSISPTFPFYLKTGKKGRWDSHANGQDQEKHTGQRHACTNLHVKPLFQTSPPLKYHFKSTSGASPLCSSL